MTRRCDSLLTIFWILVHEKISSSVLSETTNSDENWFNCALSGRLGVSGVVRRWNAEQSDECRSAHSERTKHSGCRSSTINSLTSQEFLFEMREIYWNLPKIFPIEPADRSSEHPMKGEVTIKKINKQLWCSSFHFNVHLKVLFLLLWSLPIML